MKRKGHKKRIIESMILSTLMFIGFAALLTGASSIINAEENVLDDDNNIVAIANNQISVVATESDLYEYADMLTQEHEDITNINVHEKSITVESIGTENILGFIPQEESYTTKVAFDGNNGVDISISESGNNLSETEIEFLEENIQRQIVVPANTEITPYDKAVLIRSAVINLV